MHECLAEIVNLALDRGDHLQQRILLPEITNLDLHTEDGLECQFYPVTSNQLTFKIKAPRDARIMLSSTPHESQPCFEVFFGAWRNKESMIRKNQRLPAVCLVATPNILDAKDYKGFWIRWDNNLITAGVQGNPNPLLHYRGQLFPIQYFGVCTSWGASGHWIIDHAPTPGFGQLPSQPSVYPAVPAANLPISYTSVGFNVPMPNTTGPTAPSLGSLGFQAGRVAPRWVPCGRGTVPPNAVVGGHDVSGESLYVARANHKGAVIPGKVVPSHGVTYVAWGGRENPKDSYEVLCDCSPRWVRTVGSQVPPEAFIAGQTELGEPLWVGRAHHEGSLTPGKVQRTHGVCYIPFNGEEIAKSEFEVLVI